MCPFRSTRRHGSRRIIKLASRIPTHHSLLVTYVAQNRKKAGPDFLWISWALACQKSKNAIFGTFAILEKSTIGVSQNFIFSKMGEKLDFWWGIG